ncbi:hypothetical protein [Gemmatimonas sp.]|uniref:hypothetical protein n=1 Tax=Gemmatimonas sp. TaxID=1962908 RepID=UPI003342D7BD
MTSDHVSRLIASSGLSHADFARLVLGRDPRSLRRYLAGDAIPPTLAAWLASVERVEVTRGRVTVVVQR